MDTLTDTLLERVSKLIEEPKGDAQLLCSTGPTEAIGLLAARADGLEDAVRELALVVQRLSASLDD